MTKLEDVMSEKWIADEWDGDSIVGGDVAPEKRAYCVGPSKDGQPGALYAFKAAFDAVTDEEAAIRLQVALLGKRALSLLLEHEWSGEHPDTRDYECPECWALETEGGHKPQCEWGAIVDAARRLG